MRLTVVLNNMWRFIKMVDRIYIPLAIALPVYVIAGIILILR